MLTPGPYKQDHKQIQHYLKIIVDDLLMLYEKGIVVVTPLHPNGKHLLIFFKESVLTIKGILV